VPTNARTFIDGNLVGHTPLLLIVPPGKYTVAIRGPREEFGQRVVELSPNETKQVALPLTIRYPGGVSLQKGSFSNPANRTAETNVTRSPSGTPAQEIAATGEGNRKAFEERAGRDAGKLILQSTPSEALTYIDGVYLGHTPVEIRVPPGKYNVKMTGPHGEFGTRALGVLPNEVQKVVLTLEVRYPATLSLP
jgi:hypothetical protein